MIKRIETSKNNKIFRNISDGPNNPQNWMVIKKKKKKKTLRSNTDWVCLCFASILDVEQVVANLLTGTIYRFG